MASLAEKSPLVEELTVSEDPDIDHDRRDINGEGPLREDGTSWVYSSNFYRLGSSVGTQPAYKLRLVFF